MNLVEKLEKLGLDEVKQRSAGVSPMALLAALETLCYDKDEEYDSLDSIAPTNRLPESPAIRRNKSTPSLDVPSSPRLMSPLHRSSSDQSARGFNAISDLGSPDSAPAAASSSNIRAKCQAF